MIATFKFDVEDGFYPEQYGIDDLAGWTAGIMTEVGLPATLCTMGDKARTLKDRGREDVLAAMACHDLVSHQPSNEHPTLVEVLADREWEDGIDAAADYEKQVENDFIYAYGRPPVALSRHNYQWGPQHVALAGKKGLPYMSNLVGVPGFEQPCWYANTLCLGSSVLGPAPVGEITKDYVYGISVSPEFGGYDTFFGCDDHFEQRFAEVGPFLDACVSRNAGYVEVFGCHPVAIRARGFLERYMLAGGRSRTIEQLGFVYGVRDREYEGVAKKNFRRFCEFIRNYPGIEVLSVSEAAVRFSTQPPTITVDELTAYAGEVCEAGKVLLHRTFSPAELLVAMCDSLVAAGDDNPLPEHAARLNLIGPTDMPTVGCEVVSLSHCRLMKICRQAVEYAREHGKLPGNLYVDNDRLGLGQLMVMVANAYHAQARHHRYAVLDVPEAPRYPDIAMNVDARLRIAIGENPRYDPDLSCDKIARHARLQTWSLKPAWERPPRGRYCYHGRIDFPSSPTLCKYLHGESSYVG